MRRGQGCPHRRAASSAQSPPGAAAPRWSEALRKPQVVHLAVSLGRGSMGCLEGLRVWLGTVPKLSVQNDEGNKWRRRFSPWPLSQNLCGWHVPQCLQGRESPWEPEGQTPSQAPRQRGALGAAPSPKGATATFSMLSQLVTVALEMGHSMLSLSRLF